MALTPHDAAAMLTAAEMRRPDQIRCSVVADRLRAGENVLFKGGPEHLTASCLVFDPALEYVLLQYHAKGQFWVQFGGHVERTDSSLLSAATRELSEESGLTGVTLLSQQPLDLDIQILHGRFGMCRTHFDLLFAGQTERSSRVVLNQESEAIEWFPVNELPSAAATGLHSRILSARSLIGRRPSAHS